MARPRVVSFPAAVVGGGAGGKEGGGGGEGGEGGDEGGEGGEDGGAGAPSSTSTVPLLGHELLESQLRLSTMCSISVGLMIVARHSKLSHMIVSDVTPGEVPSSNVKVLDWRRAYCWSRRPCGWPSARVSLIRALPVQLSMLKFARNLRSGEMGGEGGAEGGASAPSSTVTVPLLGHELLESQLRLSTMCSISVGLMIVARHSKLSHMIVSDVTPGEVPSSNVKVLDWRRAYCWSRRPCGWPSARVSLIRALPVPSSSMTKFARNSAAEQSVDPPTSRRSRGERRMPRFGRVRSPLDAAFLFQLSTCP